MCDFDSSKKYRLEAGPAHGRSKVSNAVSHTILEVSESLFFFKKKNLGNVLSFLDASHCYFC